jgi:hypothetical protein
MRVSIRRKDLLNYMNLVETTFMHLANCYAGIRALALLAV